MTDLAPHPFESNTGPVLLITDDAMIESTVTEIAMLHGAVLWPHSVEALPSPARWQQAGCVLVGDDAQQTVARLRDRFPRRERVVLVATDMDDAAVWRRGVDIGCEHVAHLPDAYRWLNDKVATMADNDDPYCRWCQLPRSNALHDPVARTRAAYDDAVKARDEAQDKVAKTAMACLKAMAEKDNPDACYISFSYTNEYFGHGQTGPVVQNGFLFDERFQQVPVVEDGADPYWEEWDDHGLLYAIVSDGTVETSDITTYTLRLSDGAVLEDADLHKHEDDEDTPTYDPLAP